MLSPLDALSLAGTIIQFIDFGSKVLFQSRRLYKSHDGALSVDQELEFVTADLFALSKKFPTPEKNACLTEQETTLRKLAVACSEISLELSTKLNGLKVGAKHKKWSCIRQAIKATWTEDERMDIRKRLVECRDQLQMHFVVDIRWVLLTNSRDPTHLLAN
jgi:hypothetical protein